LDGGAGGVALGHLVVRRSVGDPRASGPQTAAGEHGARGTGTGRTGSAGHDGVPAGNELHVRAAQDGRVPGRPEPSGPDTAARRLCDRGPDPADPFPVAGHQRTAVGRPWPQQRRITVGARQRGGRRHRPRPRAQDQLPPDRRPRVAVRSLRCRRR